MAVDQVDYTLEFVSGYQDKRPVIRMVVQYGDEAVCYLKDQSFARQCATRISQVTGLTFNIAKLTQDKNIAYCLRTDARNNYEYNKEVAEDLNNKYANQLRSELFGRNPAQLLYIFPDIFPEQTR